MSTEPIDVAVRAALHQSPLPRIGRNVSSQFENHQCARCLGGEARTHVGGVTEAAPELFVQAPTAAHCTLSTVDA